MEQLTSKICTFNAPAWPAKLNPAQAFARERWRDTNYSYEGKYSMKLDSSHIYTRAIEIPFKEITNSYYAWLRAGVWVYKTGEPGQSESLLVIHFTYNNRPYKYRAVSFKNQNLPFEQGKWNLLSIDYMTPEVRTTGDPVKVYVWFRGKGEIYIDNLTLEVFEPKKVPSNER